MTRAQRLKALFPAIWALYWRARRPQEEHRAIVLLVALGQTEGCDCHACARLTPSQWLST